MVTNVERVRERERIRQAIMEVLGRGYSDSEIREWLQGCCDFNEATSEGDA